ncbi:MAG: antitoxin [Alphaproteobacteria bacterium]|nr:antitoxin [Alphaproteobacteria bacterium]
MDIKNKKANRLARELAKLTGEGMTTAVTRAVRERLGRVRGRQSGLAVRLLAIGRDCAPRLGEPACSLDHGDYLYDERGLPR